MGDVIPVDGKVIEGDGMVNEASMTGESLPVRKVPGSLVYAGTEKSLDATWWGKKVK